MLLESAKILPFISRKMKKNRKLRQHQTQGEAVTPPTVRVFLRALLNIDLPTIQALVEQHPSLATVTGNYFTLPLQIASGHRNIPLINYLIEKGACIQTALNHPYTQFMPTHMKRYLATVSMLKNKIMAEI